MKAREAELALEIDIDLACDWHVPAGQTPVDWEKLSQNCVRAAFAQTAYAALLNTACDISVSIRFSDDDEVRQLNASFRAKDKPTNVLSFPMIQPDLLDAISGGEDGEILLGDLILAYETCSREAAEKTIKFAHHAAHLIVHGTLHLLGYDHELGEAEAIEMESLEIKALASLGIADPY